MIDNWMFSYTEVAMNAIEVMTGDIMRDTANSAQTGVPPSWSDWSETLRPGWRVVGQESALMACCEMRDDTERLIFFNVCGHFSIACWVSLTI